MQISANERALGVIGYIAFLFVIPLKAKKDSLFVQFHARQSGVLFGLWFAAVFVLSVLLLFLDETPIGATIVLGLLFLATGVYLVLAVIGIFKVLLGERYRMPVVADVALKLGL